MIRKYIHVLNRKGHLQAIDDPYLGPSKFGYFHSRVDLIFPATVIRRRGGVRLLDDSIQGIRGFAHRQKQVNVYLAGHINIVPG